MLFSMVFLSKVERNTRQAGLVHAEEQNIASSLLRSRPHRGTRVDSALPYAFAILFSKWDANPYTSYRI